MFINTTPYQTDVEIQYGKLEEMVTWCSNNCTGQWGYSVVNQAGLNPGLYNFKFESEKDYVTFLVWRT